LGDDGEAPPYGQTGVRLAVNPEPLSIIQWNARWLKNMIAECRAAFSEAHITPERAQAIALKYEISIPPANAPKMAPAPTVWYHGERAYSADGRTPTVVSVEQHNILQAFLDRDIALDTPALQTVGVSNVSKVMTAIEKRFPGTVQQPERKGAGYRIRVLTRLPTG
jgi:hypothetical protein